MLENDAKKLSDYRSRIIGTGDLVRIGSVLNCYRNNNNIGIIIQCTYGFGISGNQWLVLIHGQLKKVEGSAVWPIEEI